jgi:hypothetical protein
MFIGVILVEDETKCTAPRMEEIPARCREISRSLAAFVWAIPAATREDTRLAESLYE